MRRAIATAAACFAAAATLALSGSVESYRFSTSSAATSGLSVVGMRRLTDAQYKNSIADIFGADITVSGRFEPERRVAGLLSTGGALLSITPAGFEGYAQAAESVAERVIDDAHRAKLTPCAPRSATGPDDKCAAAFFSQYGRMLYRRPLTAAQLQSRVQLASKVAASSKDFYAGLQAGLVSLMTSPEFLFRVETATRDAQGVSLDGYSRAQRMSFLLWNSTPDAELLRAAAAGELQTQAGLVRQADRMLASPRVEAGLRAFYEDMFQLDKFGALSKDGQIYPNFSDRIAASAHEETLRSIIDLTFTRNGDYRDVVTTRRTFINRALASIYDVPFDFKSDWAAYEFPQSADRAGVLTQATFLSLFSHPGRSSPTLRGVALREIFMCDPTPAPPANVDFTLVNDNNNATLKTVRARLEVHASNRACASCHSRSDPIGLSLEKFDSIGQRRSIENGQPIDDSAQIGAKSFVGAAQLGQILRDDPKIPACVARNLFAYGAGLNSEELERDQLAAPLRAFEDAGYRVPVLLRYLVTDDSFYRAFHSPSAPEPATPSQRAALGGATTARP